MLEVTQAQIAGALRAVGLEAGDGVLVHSALHFLGRPAGGVEAYLAAFQEVLGPQGTLVVPAFNFGFARGERFDPQETPSDGMGVFAEYVRHSPGACRSPHPLQSVAALGKFAPDLCARDTLCAFDPGSPFERMLELDFKLMLLGASMQSASMVHYCEQRAAVPYRYWKEFSGPCRVGDRWETRTYRMFVRDLALDPQLALQPIQAALEARGAWRSQPLNYGRVGACGLADFVAATTALLRADPWALVGNRAPKAV